MIRSMAGLALALALVSCAWVELRPDARGVRAVPAAEAEGCDRIGKTRVEVADRVLAVQRPPGKIERELEVLARNAAADMGGDRIVAAGAVRDGQREYIVFDCS